MVSTVNALPRKAFAHLHVFVAEDSSLKVPLSLHGAASDCQQCWSRVCSALSLNLVISSVRHSPLSPLSSQQYTFQLTPLYQLLPYCTVDLRALSRPVYKQTQLYP